MKYVLLYTGRGALFTKALRGTDSHSVTGGLMRSGTSGGRLSRTHVVIPLLPKGFKWDDVRNAWIKTLPKSNFSVSFFFSSYNWRNAGLLKQQPTYMFHTRLFYTQVADFAYFLEKNNNPQPCKSSNGIQIESDKFWLWKPRQISSAISS